MMAKSQERAGVRKGKIKAKDKGMSNASGLKFQATIVQTRRKKASSRSSNALGASESISSTAISSPSAPTTGNTISERVVHEQAI